MASTTDKLSILIETIDRSSSGLQSIERNIRNLALSYLSFRTAQAVFQASVDVIQAGVAAAAEQEAVNTKLAVSIANMGAKSQDTVKGLGAQADALTRLTGISDEAIGEVQNLLISLGQLTGQGLERATKATLDFATQTGVDAVTAARQLSNVLSGQVQTLGRVNLGFDETTQGAERFEAVLTAMEGRFSGAAAAAGGTFAGQLRIAAEAQENLLEAIGETITQTPEATEVIRGLANIFGVLEEAVRSAGFREFVTLAAADVAALTEGVARLAQAAAILSGFSLVPGPDLSGLAPVLDQIADSAEATRKRIEDLRSAGVQLKSLEEIPIAERSQETVARIQSIRQELGLVSTATAELTAKAHELRQLELIPPADRTIDTKARIAALKDEVLAVAPAAKAAGAGLAGMDADAAELAKTLDKLGPAFGSLLDVKDLDAAKTALQAMVVDLRKLGDAGQLQLLADLDVKVPDVAKAAEAALAAVNADALVDVFAEAGDKGSLALLASMKAKLPEIAAAAERALSNIRIDAAVEDINIPELGFKIDVSEISEAAAVMRGISAFQQEIVRLQGEAVLGTANFNKALSDAVAETGSLAAAWEKVGSQVFDATVEQSQQRAIKAQGELLLGAEGFNLLMLQASAATDSQADAWKRVADEIGALDFNDINEQLVRSQGEAIVGAEEFNAMLLAAWQKTGDLGAAWAIVAEEVGVANDAQTQHLANQQLIADIQGALTNSALQFGDYLVDAAIRGGVSFKKFFTALLADLAKAITRALILRAILSFSGGGGGASAFSAASSAFAANPGGQIPVGGVQGGQVAPNVARAVGGGQIMPSLAASFNDVEPFPSLVRALEGGQILPYRMPALADGGMIYPSGLRRKDSVPALLAPGEVVVRNEVVEEIERALRTSANQRGGFAVHNTFNSVVSRDLVEQFTREQQRLAENYGLEVVATRVVT